MQKEISARGQILFHSTAFCLNDFKVKFGISISLKCQNEHYRSIRSKLVTFPLSSWLIMFNFFLVLPVGDSNKEPGSVWFESCCPGNCFAAQSAGQHCLTAHPWGQGQSPGPDPRQSDSSSRQFATRFGT